MASTTGLENTMSAAMLTLGQESWGWFDHLMLRAPTSSTVAGHTDWMYMFIWWFSVVWFVFLMGLMFYFVVKYRRRPGKIAPRSTSHHTPLEVAWTIVPTLCLAFIFVEGFRGYMVKVASPGDAMELKLTGYKWSWDMQYPNGLTINRGVPKSSVVIGAEPAPVFYVPAETPIRLRMNSTDVMHAFWIPDFRVKADLIPNRYTSMWFEAMAPDPNRAGVTVKYHPKSKEEAERNKATDKMAPEFIEELAGIPYTDHWVFCAEYCGTSHSEMAAVIRVVPAEGYTRWMGVMNQLTQPSDPIELGKIQYRGKCIACHSVDGSKNTGPTWQNMFGYEVEFTDGSKYTAEQMSDTTFFANYIRESTRAPSVKVVKGYGNNMNAFSTAQLSEKQLDAIIAYMMSPELTDRPPQTNPFAAPPAEAPSEGNATRPPAPQG